MSKLHTLTPLALLLPLLAACELGDTGISVVRTDTGIGLAYDDVDLTDVNLGDVGLDDLDLDDVGGDGVADAVSDLGQSCGTAAADRDRLVLAGPTYEPRAHILALSRAGVLSNTGRSVSLVGNPTGMAFSPNGEVALIGTRRNDSAGYGVFEISSFRVDGDQLSHVDTFELASPVEQILVSPDGRRAIVTGMDSTDEAGVYTYDLGCDGALTPRPDAHFPLRLVGSMAWLVPGERLLVSGGQVIHFEPQESQDLWILDWTGSGWSVAATYDFWDVDLLATELALTADRRRLILPNYAPSADAVGRIHVYDIDGTQVTLRAEVNVDQAERAALSADGQTLYMTQPVLFTGTRLTASGSSYRAVETIDDVALPSDIVRIERGALSDTFLMDAIDLNDNPYIQLFHFEGSQVRFGSRLLFDAQIGHLAVQP